MAADIQKTTMADLRAHDTSGLSADTSAELTGYHVANDYGANKPPYYLWKPESVLLDNKGSIIQPDDQEGSAGRWIMGVPAEYWRLEWYGWRADDLDSSADMNSDALEYALDYAKNTNIKKIRLPILSGKINRRLLWTEKYYDVELFGDLVYEKISLDSMKARWVDFTDGEGNYRTNPLHQITWTDAAFEFWVVDESQSSIIKRVTDLDLWSGTQKNMIQVGYAGTDKKVKFRWRNIAVNGNRQPTDTRAGAGFYHNIRMFPGDAYHFIDEVESIVIDKIASYNAVVSGIAEIDAIKNVEFKGHILSYNCGETGFLGSGGSENNPIKCTGTVEVHSSGLDFMAGVNLGGNLPTGNGYWDIEELYAHHNYFGLKTSHQTRLTDVETFKIDYNLVHGYHPTAAEWTLDDGKHGGKIYVGEFYARYNGGYGVNWNPIYDNRIDLLHIEDNNKRDDDIARSNALLRSNVRVGKLISKDMVSPAASAYNTTGFLKGWGDAVHAHNIQIHDNVSSALRIDRTSSIKSGRIYNNDGRPIFISSDTPNMVTLGNLEIKNNTDVISNNSTIKYTNVVDQNGDPITPPGTVIKLPTSEITNSNVSGTSVELTFNAATAQDGRTIDKVRLYRYVTGSENPLSDTEDQFYVEKTGAGPHTHTVEGLDNDKYYRFYTIAIDNVGDEGLPPLDFDGNMQGELVEIGTAAVPAIPTLDSPTNEAEGIDKNVTYKWNAASGADTYTLQYSVDITFANNVTERSGLAGLEKSETLNADTLYYWRVKAVNEEGSSDWSNVWSFTTAVDPGGLPVPTLSSPVDGATGLSRTPMFDWSVHPFTYRIRISKNEDLSNPVIDTTLVLNTFTVPDAQKLEFGALYYWSVRTEDNGEVSSWATRRSFAVHSDKQIFRPVTAGSTVPDEWVINDSSIENAIGTVQVNNFSISTSDANVPIKLYLQYEGGDAGIIPADKTGWIATIRTLINGDYNLEVRIVEGVTTRKEWVLTDLTSSYSLRELNMETDANDVTDVNNLFIEFEFVPKGS